MVDRSGYGQLFGMIHTNLSPFLCSVDMWFGDGIQSVNIEMNQNSSLSGTLSILGLVVSVVNVGFAWFIVLSVVAMLQLHVSNLWLCRSAEIAQKFETHKLAKHYLGTAGSVITKVMICFGNWLFIVNIIQVPPHRYTIRKRVRCVLD